MNRCEAELDGGCANKVKWIVKAARFRFLSCGSHLNMVCNQMLQTGVEYMTVTRSDLCRNLASVCALAEDA